MKPTLRFEHGRVRERAPTNAWLRRGMAVPDACDRTLLALVPEQGRAPYDEVVERLSGRLLDHVWPRAGGLEVGLWGNWLCRADAERRVEQAIARGVLAREGADAGGAPLVTSVSPQVDDDAQPALSAAGSRRGWLSARLGRGLFGHHWVGAK